MRRKANKCDKQNQQRTKSWKVQLPWGRMRNVPDTLFRAVNYGGYILQLFLGGGYINKYDILAKGLQST